MTGEPTWEATLLVEDEPTPDRRTCAPGSIWWKEVVPVYAPPGSLVGHVDRIRREGNLIRGTVHVEDPAIDLGSQPVGAEVRVVTAHGELVNEPTMVITEGELIGVALVPEAAWVAARVDEKPNASPQA